jgi:uncharacterized protein with FMN-binding domain
MTEQTTPPTSPPTPPPPPAPQAKKGKGRKIWLIVLIVIVVLVVAGGVIGGLYAWRFTSAVKNIDIDDVDISSLPDGTYRGTYKTFHITAEVTVTVEDGEVTEIVVVGDEGHEGDISDLMDRVIEEQSVTVDLVSGPSASQKVTLKAVEIALTGE